MAPIRSKTISRQLARVREILHYDLPESASVSDLTLKVAIHELSKAVESLAVQVQALSDGPEERAS